MSSSSSIIPHACTCLVDAAAPDLAGKIVEASKLEPEAFRYGYIENRPCVPDNADAIGFQYFRYGIGGGEKVTRMLMELFCKQGRRAILYVDELVEDAEDLGLPTGATRKVVPCEPTERAAFWAHEVARENLCCVVYGTWLSSRAPLDCLAIQTAGAAFVLETHGTATYLFDCPGNKERWDDVLRCAWAADLLVCLSESDRVFWGTFNRNVRYVTNPLDSRMDGSESCKDAPHYDVVFCGRLDPHEKRPDEALRVFAAAHKQLPSIRMAFVGDGPARKELERLGEELGVADAVSFLGFQKDPNGLVENAGVLVLTSPSEGFPLVLTEAACLGTPCVVYEMPHLTVLRGNGGAVQIPQGDWEAGGLAVAQLLSNRELRARTAQAGREFYARMSQADHAAVWSHIIDDAVAAARSPHVTPNPGDDPVHALVFNAVAASRREALRCKDFEDRMNAEWRRANEAEAQLRALRASHSFRVGEALAWLPRKLRGRLR